MSRVILYLLLAMLLALPSQRATAHALEPGYLELREIGGDSWQVFFRRPDVSGRPMAIEVALPETCAGSPSAPVFDGRAWSARWVATCRGELAGERLGIVGLDQMRTDVLVRIADGAEPAVTARLTPAEPDLVVPGRHSVLQVFRTYTRLGFTHISGGIDHLLFVFALLLLVRDPWRLAGAITAFTVAHSITLALATLGVLMVPGLPVEAVIALSIVFLAREIILRRPGMPRLSEIRPWLISFPFGLLHGLGFASALSEIGLPQGAIPAALLAFNIGVEIGQLAFVVLVLGVGALLAAGYRLLSSLVVANPSGTAGAMLVGSARYAALGWAIGAVSTVWLAERVAGF